MKFFKIANARDAWQTPIGASKSFGHYGSAASAAIAPDVGLLQL
jgi:hypothetical protein